MELSSTTQRK